jgi:predicted nucleic acid-binding Zn ribbon protein
VPGDPTQDPAVERAVGDGTAQAAAREGAAAGGAPDGEQGAQAARAALNRARAAAAARGLRPAAAGRRSDGTPASAWAAAQRRRVAGATRSGSGPDARDPQPLAPAIARLVAERGWTTPVAVGGVVGRWDGVVGPEVAAHCAPESFDDGVLVVRADSTAWATQVRLLAPALLRRLGEELGPGVVRRVTVRGPGGPSWRRGARTVSGGRGPRDTYG